MRSVVTPALQIGITLGVALLGAVLGIVNLWRAIDRDRIRLRVSPCFYMHPEEPIEGICIEVVNLGYLPVTVSQVGFLVSGARKQFIFPEALFLDKTNLPQRLEARASLTAFIPAGTQNDPVFADVTRAFAKTACGRKFTGSSPYLKDCIKAARTAKKGSA